MDLLSTVILFGASKAIESKTWKGRDNFPVGLRRAEPIGVVVFSVFMIARYVNFAGGRDAVPFLLGLMGVSGMCDMQLCSGVHRIIRETDLERSRNGADSIPGCDRHAHYYRRQVLRESGRSHSLIPCRLFRIAQMRHTGLAS